MLTDNIRIAKKRVDLILREAPFIGIIRIRFTGYNLSPSAVYVGHPFVLRWQRYGKEMNNATTDCFIFCGRMFFYDYLALCLFILVKG